MWGILFVIAGLWLWWPRYDLEVALKPGPSAYQIVEYDFYTLKSCREAVGNWGVGGVLRDGARRDRYVEGKCGGRF